MSKDGKYMTIQALAAELGIKAALMEKGQLNAEQIDSLADLAKELYERMIVLRYKAYEAMVRPPDETAESTPEPEPVYIAKEPEPAPAPKPAAKTPLKFGQPEVSPNQISLIDSIEEISKEEGKAAKAPVTAEPTIDEDKPSLAQKLKKTPVANLKTAIGINQKFLYISTLFLNDKEAYNAAVEQLNSFRSYIEADEFVQNVLKTRYDWQAKNPVVKEFLELIERRYL